MKKIYVLLIALVLAIAGAFALLLSKNGPKPASQKVNFSNNTHMTLESPQFKNNDNIPAKFSCQGLGVNPPLMISGVPAKAKSLALAVNDPDAPSGNFVHWLVWNIDPGTSEIAEGSVPKNAVQGRTSAGTNSYVGPCPPTGTHRYYFKLYALDRVLDLGESADEQALVGAIQGHIIAQADLMGLYQKK